MEFAVVTVQRSLDLARNYAPVKAGNLQVGLQAIKDEVAEIEVQGPEGMTQARIPMATAASVQGYTIIVREVGVVLPQEKKRRRLAFFGGGQPPQQGTMEAVLDIRWGDQALLVPEPVEHTAYDFLLVKQYAIVHDRPMVYQNQDVLQFGKMRLWMGERVEPDSRNFRRERYAPMMVQMADDDEPEAWQIRLNEKYQRQGRFRVKITYFDWDSDWYQSYGLSVVEGRLRDEADETEDILATGIVNEGFAPHHEGASLSRLEEARQNPDEVVLRAGESRTVNGVGLRVMEVKPGMVKVMFLEPGVKITTLQHGEGFDFLRWDVALIGVYGEQCILRIVEEA
ncbi:MAG: hypothetical protein HC915_01180 [Anaerolineae bacterium]|nr:hypothetical protein [Anaerolineae bacterium]